MLEQCFIHDVNDDICTTPTEPWAVFTAGAMGAGKSFTIRRLMTENRFPLLAFVSVDPDLIRRHLPEFEAYVEQNPDLAGELTRKGERALMLHFFSSHIGGSMPLIWTVPEQSCCAKNMCLPEPAAVFKSERLKPPYIEVLSFFASMATDGKNPLLN